MCSRCVWQRLSDKGFISATLRQRLFVKISSAASLQQRLFRSVSSTKSLQHLPRNKTQNTACTRFANTNDSSMKCGLDPWACNRKDYCFFLCCTHRKAQTRFPNSIEKRSFIQIWYSMRYDMQICYDDSLSFEPCVYKHTVRKRIWKQTWNSNFLIGKVVC